ncbi:MAG: hypothetical protein WC895_01160 [Candidatus Shapirobacteria bacterium]|jgi:hypothetical protein
MTSLEPIKYKFAFDPKKIEKVEKFVQTNFNADSIKFEVRPDKTTISFVSGSKKETFKFHNFLLEIHEITGNKRKKEVKKPKVSITLKGEVNKGFYFNYLLGGEFCQILKDSAIEFSVAKIKKNAFHYLDTCPIWIAEEDLKKVKDSVKKSMYGKTYHIVIINRNIVQD